MKGKFVLAFSLYEFFYQTRATFTNVDGHVSHELRM